MRPWLFGSWPACANYTVASTPSGDECGIDDDDPEVCETPEREPTRSTNQRSFDSWPPLIRLRLHM